MIRKLVLGTVAAVGLGFGAQSASAHEPVRGPIVPPVGGPIGGPGGFVPRHDHDFIVYVGYRHRGHIDWERYGRYETRWQAERAERLLERQGYRVRIEEVHDRGPRPW